MISPATAAAIDSASRSADESPASAAAVAELKLRRENMIDVTNAVSVFASSLSESKQNGAGGSPLLFASISQTLESESVRFLAEENRTPTDPTL
jgi:hypothetical protein